ncbi:Bug family tripartite tricarboxylate transporter substrate binding protein [Cupriavidus sp. CuC1]|uniref:Bug family tripartite tricarboxylate transporter substrate binding protein n=1 Tax=Cupriavidus TaxID=106589 RepID=UPI00296B090F|nr:tripartite tricarboxylate transporter substrate binding protein [Cupriavidus sp. CV2]MDW3684653.1 tripartite tricarboxylate transporter substrate binding protein [Cupriavidus sp. CV2]
MNFLLKCLRLVAAGLPLLATAAHGEPAYPSRPIRILVGFSPGGSNDIVARLLAPKLSEVLGQQVLIDNRPGAGGNIAADTMLKAPADGHTLMICTTGMLSIQPSLQKVSYDPQTDIIPVSLIANTPYIALVNAALPIHNVKELIAYAKANPGKLNFASSGNGTAGHLAGEMLKLRAGINIVHVPYKGTGQAMTDLLGGQVSLIFDQPISSLPYAKSGKLRVLGVASLQRLQSLPDVPTFAESGVPGFDPVAWTGLCAAKGTPASVVARLQHDVAQVLRQPEIAQRLSQDGMEVVGSTSDKFREFLVSDKRKWVSVIKEANVTLN